MSTRSLFARVVGRMNRLSAASVRTRTVRMANERPILSLTFDDFPQSAARVGARILESSGLAGTFYLCRSFCGAAADGIDYYDRGDLRSLIDAGHEIGCHTASHLHVSGVPNSRLGEDIHSNAQFVRDELGDVRLSTFAFPFGDINLSAKLFLQTQFAACRSSLPGGNFRTADLGALRAERLYSRLTSPEALRPLLKKFAVPRSWLIFYSHDIADDPSPYGCTPALLESAVRSALDAGYRVLTVRNALGAIRFRSQS
jgi:peptidoglycan/xylan/chitin deacetylase (PgdA/CDA1 family)